MSGPEHPRPDDRQLDDFLAGRDPLSRSYHEGASETPPPEIDARLLRAARDALQRQPEGPATAFRDRRWRFAIAAVIVLSFSTLLLIREDPGARRQLQMESDVVVPPTVSITPTPAIPESVNPQPAEPPQPLLRQRREAEVAPTPFPAAPAEAPVPTPEPMTREREAKAAAADALQREEAPAAPPAMEAAPAARAPAAAGAVMQKSEERMAPTPEQELQRIRELLRAGERERALAALREFRERYPDYALPVDLRELR